MKLDCDQISGILNAFTKYENICEQYPRKSDFKVACKNSIRLSVGMNCCNYKISNYFLKHAGDSKY